MNSENLSPPSVQSSPAPRPRRVRNKQLVVPENSILTPEEFAARKRATRLRLRLTCLGGVLLFWLSWQWGRREIAEWSLIPGAIISTVGLLLRIWATGWLCKDEVLVREGPYAFTRNPLYLGTVLITLGQSLMSGLPYAPVFFPLICIAVYWPTMKKEEALLAGHYGADYEAYRATTPLLLPRPWPVGGLRQSSVVSAIAATAGKYHQFSWPRVHRCYKGFVANLLVIGVYFLIHSTR